MNQESLPGVAGLETLPIFLMEGEAGFRMIGVLVTAVRQPPNGPFSAAGTETSEGSLAKR